MVEFHPHYDNTISIGCQALDWYP